MPTYQYACTDCAERSEVVQKFTDEPLLVCSLCGGRLRKVFSPVGIVFKGSGFYRTDSRGAGVNGSKEKQLNGASSDSSSASEKSSGADAKPSASGPGSSGTESKSQKKTENGGSGKSSSAGSKVA